MVLRVAHNTCVVSLFPIEKMVLYRAMLDQCPGANGEVVSFVSFTLIVFHCVTVPLEIALDVVLFHLWQEIVYQCLFD